MYPSIVITGWKATPKGPVAENIYTGNDGVAALAASEKARKSEKFIRIGKLVNPTMVPLATVLHASEKKKLPPPPPPLKEEQTETDNQNQ